MADIFKKHRGFWDRERMWSLWTGIGLFAFALVVQIVLGRFSSRVAVNAAPVRDLFLDNLPLLDFTPLIVGGAIVLWVFAWGLLVVHPRRLLFATKAIALYIISRAFFFSLTHVGPYPLSYSPSPHNHGYGLYHLITFQGNFFYSGHTAFPFLLALLFWDDRRLRYIFLFLTAFFGITVLFAHVHYSIDVFAAPFIVYGMFVIAKRLFPADYALWAS